MIPSRRDYKKKNNNNDSHNVLIKAASVPSCLNQLGMTMKRAILDFFNATFEFRKN